MVLLLQIFRSILNCPSNKGQRLKRIFLFFGWQFYKRIIGKPLVYHLDNSMRYLAYPHSTGASYPFYFAIYDYPNIVFLRTHLSGRGSIIDIGANIGLYTLSLVDCFQNAVLIEPDHRACRMLRENLVLNQLDHRCSVIEAAAGDVDADVLLDKIGDASPINKVSINGTIPVRQRSIDSLLKEQAQDRFLPIEFVKIDVEGYELMVLRGMRDLLTGKNPPKIIQFERLKCTPLAPIREFFAELNWAVFAIDHHGKPATSDEAIRSAHDLMAVHENGYDILNRNHGFC